MAIAGYGKAKYGHRSGWERFKLAEGANIYRLLPPMKTGCPSTWARYVGVHYGYKGIDSRDPTKLRARPFVCIRETNFKTKMVIQECPECQNIERRKKELSFETARAQHEKMDGMVTKALLEPLKEWLKEHNCDRKWYINAKNQAGKFGVLLIPHKGCKTALDEEIKSIIEQYGFDPLSCEKGVWFNFHRTGMDLSTSYAIKPIQIPVEQNGKRYMELKIDEMSEAEQEAALEACPDLAEVAKTITFEQIRALVEGSGDPHEVDAIMGASQSRGRGEQTPRPSYAPQMMNGESDEPMGMAGTVSPASSPSPAPVAASVLAEEDEEAALMAKLAAARAKKAAAAAVPAPSAAQVVPAPAQPAGSAVKMTNEDFLKQFGG